jgi:hypothetical protein
MDDFGSNNLTGSPTQSRMECSSFVFPAWWVSAFDYPGENGESLQSRQPIADGEGRQLFPRLNDFEMTVAAVLLSVMQRSILTAPNDSIHISLNEIRKIISGSGGLRDGLRDISKSVESFLATQFMVSTSPDKWRTCARVSDQISFELGGRNHEERWTIDTKISDRQFLVGLFDGHADLNQLAESGHSFCEQFAQNAPLTMWAAPWLDLTGPEQKFLLRLEKSIQWQFKWVHLDGIFSEDIRLLTQGLKFGQTGTARPGGVAGVETSFMAACRILGRLVEHGLLSDIDRLPYIAIQTADIQDLQLVWKLSAVRVKEFEQSDYQDNIATGLLKSVFLENLESLFDRMTMGHSSIQLNELRTRVVNALPELSREFGDDIWKPMIVRGSKLISRCGQFVEWAIRCAPGHPMRLPQDFLDLGLTDCLLRSSEDLLVGFREFLARTSELQDVIERIIDQPKVSLATSVGNKSERSSIREGLSRSARLPEIQTVQIAEQSADSESQMPEMNVRPQPPPNPAPAERSMVLGIRQVASDELLKMRKTDPEEYERLKIKYFDSLDPSRRKLLLDVRKRMTPDTFEQHLRHSLIKFMIENPVAWQTRKIGEPSKTSSQNFSSAIWGN